MAEGQGYHYALSLRHAQSKLLRVPSLHRTLPQTKVCSFGFSSHPRIENPFCERNRKMDEEQQLGAHLLIKKSSWAIFGKPELFSLL